MGAPAPDSTPTGHHAPPPPGGGGDASAAERQGTAQFRYHLPPELIAIHPVEPRSASRLLVHLPRLPAAPQLARHVERACHALPATPGAAGSVLPSGGRVFDLGFAQLPDVLPAHAHLVFNHSQVFAARLHAALPRAASKAAGGGKESVEVLLLSPLSPADPSAALASPPDGQLWRVMVRAPLQAAGDNLEVTPQVTPQVTPPADGAPAGGGAAGLRLAVEEILAPWVESGETDGVEAAVRLSTPDPHGSKPLDGPRPLGSLLEGLGQTPLPPYLGRDATAADSTRYQTVYAEPSQAGSVAAPTAGLHFTPQLLARLDAAGVRSSRLALHVGAGTFKPVSAPTLGGHAMHEERFAVSSHALAALATSAAEGRPLVPVGTTSARVLESLYWMALRDHPPAGGPPRRGLEQRPPCGDLGHLSQWEAYAATPHLSRAQALAALSARAAASGGGLHGTTSLCVSPGYRFALCDGLVTNFHAPDSTLMCLVAALMGGAPNAAEVYAHAVAARYRFLSYGDSSFIARADDA